MYSQDAYLRGNEPYTGEAQNLPEPPPVCYPNSKPTTTSPNHGLPDNLNCKLNPPLDISSVGDISGITGHCLEGVGTQRVSPSHHRLTHHRSRSSSSAGITMNPLDFHFANHNAAIASTTLPHPRKGSLPQARSELCHQALSDWYYSQADRPGLDVSHQHRSISQDRLCELGLGGPYGGWRHSASHDTLLLHYTAGMGVNHSHRMDGYGLGRSGMSGGHTSGRSCSENLLAAYASYEQSYGRSLETLEKASALISPRYERTPWPHQSTQPMRAEERPGLGNHQAGITAPLGRGSGQAQQQQVGSQSHIRRLPAQTVDDQTVGYRSYSPSFCRKASHLMQKSHSFRDPSYSGPHLSWTTSPPESTPSLGRETSSLSVSSTLEPQDSTRPATGVGGFIDETLQSQIQEVVLRQKPPTGRKTPHGVRHNHYALPVDSPQPFTATTPTSRTEDPVHRTNGGIPPPPVEQESLAAIPFIGQYH